jgi:conjugal transfer ATP-binding protein TraC
MFDSKIQIKKKVKSLKLDKFQSKYKFTKEPLRFIKDWLVYREEFGLFNREIESLYTTKKKEKQAELQKFLPREVEIGTRELKVGSAMIRTFYLGSFPDIARVNQMVEMLNLPIPFTLSYSIEGTKKGKLIKVCNGRISSLQGQLEYERQTGRSTNQEVEKQIREIQTFIYELEEGLEEAFYISIYASIQSENKEQLEKYSKLFLEETKDMNFSFYNSYLNQKDAFLQTLPIALESKDNTQIVNTNAIANLSPILSKGMSDEEGIYLGNSLINGSLILVDFFKNDNSNFNIFGKSGSGKSVLSKLIISRLLLRGVQNVVIDPEAEYIQLASKYGGEVISFSREEGINPFYIYSEKGTIDQSDQQDQIIRLKEFFELFINERNKDSGLLGEFLSGYFNSVDGDSRNLNSFLEYIKRIAKKQNIPFLNDILELELGRSFGGYFNSNRSFDLSSELIVFNLKNIKEESIKIPAMYLLTKMVQKLADNVERKTMIYVDEAHLMLKYKITGEFLQQLSKTVRKRNTGLVCISQELEDFRIENGGKTLITQSECNFILKQSTSSLNYIIDNRLLSLSDEEQRNITGFKAGQTYLLRQGEHTLLQVVPFEEEKELVFTSYN